jgi:hypothetical protein
LDREKTRKDRAGDTNGTAALDEIQKHLNVEEQLCNNKVGTCIDLCLEVHKVILFAGVIYVALRVSYFTKLDTWL